MGVKKDFFFQFTEQTMETQIRDSQAELWF